MLKKALTTTAAALTRRSAGAGAGAASASASASRVGAAAAASHSFSTTASSSRARLLPTSISSSSRLAFLGLLAATSGLAAYHFSAPSSSIMSAAVADSGLKPDAFTSFKVKSVTKYNHDSVIVTLHLASPDALLDLPVSSAVLAKFTNAEGKDVVRPYTPLTATAKGEVELLIKVYPNSQMGTHVAALKPGDSLDLKGPIKKLQYVTNGKREVGLVAGGTGITPMLQVIDKIVSNPQDHTKVTLLFANKTPQDILLRERLDAITAKHSNVKVVYFVDNAPFNGEIGHINAAKLKQYLPAPADDVMIYVCGPPPFYAAISGSKAPDYSQGELSGALLQLGYTKDMVFKV